ncbi:MAG: GntR family transcriptional regulator [Hyphomicrobiales bacterium]
MNKGRVEELYQSLKEMTVDFRLRPGERINEVELSKALGASRTPLREALNRLVAEGFIGFERGKGFICRKLSVREVQNLYQMRTALETYAVRLAAEKASDDELAEIESFLARTSDETSWPLEDMVAFDEHFHEAIAKLTENEELVRTLKNINARIRFFRWVDMQARRPRTQNEHREILDAIQSRDVPRAVVLMETHIERRGDEIAHALKECYAKLFLDGDFTTPTFVDEVRV